MIDSVGDPITLVLPQQEVEAVDLRPFLRRFGRDVLPEGRELAILMGRFNFVVHGYDDEPDEVYAIKAVRTYYQALREEWPYWFFFCDLRGEGLMMMTACCMRQLSGVKRSGQAQAGIMIDPMELVHFVSEGFTPMNEMFERGGLPETAIYDRTGEIMRYYGLPFEEPPSD